MFMYSFALILTRNTSDHRYRVGLTFLAKILMLSIICILIFFYTQEKNVFLLSRTTFARYALNLINRRLPIDLCVPACLRTFDNSLVDIRYKLSLIFV